MASNQFNKKDFTELDFFKSREELIKFLKGKTEFQDFNYDGPALRILIDALTYTTHQLALYANLSLSEVFLDSAQIRGNVVSQAKVLGLIPRSRNGSSAVLKVTVSADAGQTLYVEEGIKFAAQDGNSGYTFTNHERVEFTEVSAGVYEATIEVFEGAPTIQMFTYSGVLPNEMFTLTNRELDTRFIEIISQSGTKTWTNASSIVGLTDKSNVFFVQEGPDGFYQIYFGDGVIGVEPEVGEDFEITYYVTVGENGNGIQSFDLIDTITGINVVLTSVETVTASQNGSEREDIESIRTTAPKTFKAQNRAVTKEDFIALLKSRYGFIENISVWGGEENDPPYYGKVFISVKPYFGEYLSPTTKERIKNETIDSYSIVGITPEVVDPDYTFVDIVSEVTFRKDLTPLTNTQIATLVEDAINQYFTDSVSQFDGTLRYSRLLESIDDANPSILSNATDVKLKKKFIPTPSVLTERKFLFSNEIVVGSVISDEFIDSSGNTVQFKDDSSGSIWLYVNGGRRLKIGSIDYKVGTIIINAYSFPVPNNTEIVLRAEPKLSDIKTIRNNIIVVDDVQVNVIRKI